MIASIETYQLKEGDMVDSIPLNSKGYLIVEMGESSPCIKVYDDASTKLIFAICLCDGIPSKELEDVVKEYTDAKNLIANGYFDSAWPYLSVDESRKKLLTKEGLKDFIFNPRSLLIIHK